MNRIWIGRWYGASTGLSMFNVSSGQHFLDLLTALDFLIMRLCSHMISVMKAKKGTMTQKRSHQSMNFMSAILGRVWLTPWYIVYITSIMVKDRPIATFIKVKIKVYKIKDVICIYEFRLMVVVLRHLGIALCPC